MKMPWEFQAEASCLGIDSEFFFPEKNIWSIENQQVKKLCQTCMVKKDCLDYALRHSVDGIWGGTNRRQRQKLRKQLNIVPIPIKI